MVGAGLESGLCEARIARVLGRSPSVIRGGIKRNAGADGCYRGGEAGRYLPKGTPITSHQPYPGAIADEPGNCPRATLDYPTPQEAFTQLIATTP